MYKPIEIADQVYSVGCRDWDIRDFHGYSTDEGTSYNSFLVLGEKNILTQRRKDAKKKNTVISFASLREVNL